MRDDYKEQLSALVDDELRPEEARFLTARVGAEAAARARIGRYVAIRHALDGSLTLSPDGRTRYVADQVAVALEAEPAHDATVGGSWRQRWLKPAAGVALAASVAAVTVALWPTNTARQGPASPQTTQSIADTEPRAGARSVAGEVDSASGVDVAESGQGRHATGSLQPAVQQRLNSYMINHSEHSANAGMGGVMTYVRIAGHEADE